MRIIVKLENQVIMWMKHFLPQRAWIVFCTFLILPFISPAQNEINVPKGMTIVSGDTIQVGSNKGRADEKPTFPFSVKSFLIDVKPITVKEFRTFIRVTRYATDAEKIGRSFVFNTEKQKWDTIAGAYWLYPQGRNNPVAKNSNPVTQISWNDAKAYATWIGKRLPTEFEYELVAKNIERTKAKDINRKLWHWCEDWYRSYGEDDYYTRRINDKKVLRGGVFAFSPREYRPSQRLSALPYYSSNQIGFRCAKDL